MAIRNGISPLITTVLLIAFATGMAAILLTWGNALLDDRTSQVDNQTEDVIACTEAGLNIFSTDWDGANSNATVVIENTGHETFPAGDLNIAVLEGGALLASATNNGSTLASGDLYQQNFTGIQEPDEARVGSTKCPEVSASELF